MIGTREALYRLLLVSGSILVTLVVGEVGLRLWERLGSRPPREVVEQLERSAEVGPEGAFGRRGLRGLVGPSGVHDIVYELRPGLSGTFLGAPFSINGHGLRDRPYSLDKPPGTFRIVGLGDSVMFGWGVGQDESYLEVLEAALNRDGGQGRRFEVLNFAVPGYNTAMEVETFERKALAFDPDLVVLHFVRNDFDPPRFLLEPRSPWALDRSALWGLVTTRLGWLAESSEARLLNHDLGQMSEDDRQRVREQYRHMVGEEGFHRAIGRLAELAGRRGVPVIVVYLAAEGEPWSLVSEVVAEHDFEPLVYDTLYAAHMAEHGIEPTRQGWIDTFWLSKRDAHPNALGHRLIAGALLEKLRSMGWGE